ncbi:hypothetical protein BDW59DRAFT_122110 [Aspergillus cavernicola]|uniref:Uncharacterized protein n=1 Tax=Aspergillus cavernicola TaxID=176166 RepID=A0ABR4HV46_9EURO
MEGGGQQVDKSTVGHDNPGNLGQLHFLLLANQRQRGGTAIICFTIASWSRLKLGIELKITREKKKRAIGGGVGLTCICKLPWLLMCSRGASESSLRQTHLISSHLWSKRQTHQSLRNGLCLSCAYGELDQKDFLPSSVFPNFRSSLQIKMVIHFGLLCSVLPCWAELVMKEG